MHTKKKFFSRLKLFVLVLFPKFNQIYAIENDVIFHTCLSNLNIFSKLKSVNPSVIFRKILICLAGLRMDIISIQFGIFTIRTTNFGRKQFTNFPAIWVILLQITQKVFFSIVKYHKTA